MWRVQAWWREHVTNCVEVTGFTFAVSCGVRREKHEIVTEHKRVVAACSMAAFLAEFDRTAKSAGPVGFLEGDWQVPRVPRPDSVPSVVTHHLQSPTARRRDVISEARARVAASERHSPGQMRVKHEDKAEGSVVYEAQSTLSPKTVPKHLQRGAAVLQALSSHVASPIALPSSNHWMDTDELKRFRPSNSDANASLDCSEPSTLVQRTINVVLKPRRSSRSRSPPKSTAVLQKPTITIPKVAFTKLQRAKTHHTLPKSPQSRLSPERVPAFPLASPVKHSSNRKLSPLKSPNRALYLSAPAPLNPRAKSHTFSWLLYRHTAFASVQTPVVSIKRCGDCTTVSICCRAFRLKSVDLCHEVFFFGAVATPRVLFSLRSQLRTLMKP